MVVVQERRQLASSLLPTGFTGSLTVATDAPASSFIADSTAAGSSLGSLAPSITITVSSSGDPSSSTDDSSFSNPSDTAVASTSSASKSSIPLGTVVGVCVGVLVVLAIALFVMVRLSANTRKLRELAQKSTSSKNNRFSTMADGRNSRQDIERRKSGREMWMKMSEAEGNGDQQREKFPTRAVGGGGGAVGNSKPAAAKSIMGDDATTIRVMDDDADAKTYVERSVTVKSAKSTKTFKSIGYGVGLGLQNSFRSNDPPPQLEFTDSDIGTGLGFTRNATAPFARGNNPDSWDGSTVADDSFLSLKHASVGIVTGNLSPSIVQTHQTPPATENKTHRWEEAEVVSPGGSEVYDDPSKPKHPYATASPVIIREPSIKATTINPFLDQNPFDDAPSPAFRASEAGARGDSTFASSVSSYSDYGVSPPFSSASDAIQAGRQQDALASLIAALNISPEDAKKRLSMAQSAGGAMTPTTPYSAMSLASKYSDASGNEIEKFPMPPPLPQQQQSPRH